MIWLVVLKMASAEPPTPISYPASLWGLELTKKKFSWKSDSWQMFFNRGSCQSSFLRTGLTLVMSRSIFTTFSMLAPVPSRKGRPSELLKWEGRERQGSYRHSQRWGLHAVRQPSNGQAIIICYYRLLKSTVRLNFSKREMIYYCLIIAVLGIKTTAVLRVQW